MRNPRGIGSVCVVFALSSLLLVPTARAAEVSKLSLDDAAALGTSITTDKMAKCQGQGCVKISTRWPTTICLGEVSGLDVDNARLIYQAKVKCDKLQGTAFLEMWCFVGKGQYFSRGMNSVVTGTTDWKTLQTPFILQPGQKATKVVLNIMINGKGTVWVDDARLLEKPLK